MPGSPVRSRLRALVFVALGLTALRLGLAAPDSGTSPPAHRVFVFDAHTAGGRLRVGGTAGDLVLASAHARAVVRRRDGALVDFWPLPERAPTAPALGRLTRIDGLWQLRQVLQVGQGRVPVEIDSVRAVDDEIETVGQVRIGRARARAVTRYRLDPSSPRLVITTRYTLEQGAHAVLAPGDAVKWGNVDYWIEGVGRGPATFHGQARWIGRRGASGDLVLRTLHDRPMRIDYQLHHHGIASEFKTRYVRTRLVAGAVLTVQRSLGYEALPEPPRAAAPSSARLSVNAVDESGAPLPFKLSLRGQRGTPDPDFGNDGDEQGAGRFAWSGDGKLTLALPPGRYRALATAGIERAAHAWQLEARAGEHSTTSVQLPRVIATPGVIAADLHLHQAASVDADVAPATRIVSAAAEGLELVVSTDHYVVSDLGPAARELVASGRLSRPLATIAGTEVSTVGNEFGHFNVFPLPPGAEIPYQDSTPAALFASMRGAAPRGIVQVNHPRLADLGYFDQLQLDPTTGRVPERRRAEFRTDFDALEVYNGMEAWSQPRVRRVVLDWLHLLGRGHRFTATGGSDAHKLFFVDPGLPRNLIRYGSGSAGDAHDVTAPPEAVIEAIRQGRVLVTSGPIVDLDVDGVGPGGTARGGPLKQLRIQVRAAPWIDVSDVEVLLGPTAQRLRWINVPATSAPLRLDRTLPVPVTRRTFVVVLVRGRRDLPNVYLPGVKPLAITNPIWLEP